MTTLQTPRFSQELQATLRLAAPLALAQIAQMGMGLTDTILIGALGRDALAAGGLGAGLFFTVSAVLQGLVFGVGILVAHARGAATYDKIPMIVRGGFIVATLVALPLMIVLWNIEPILLALGEPPQLAHDVQGYVRILLFATPASLWLAVQRSYLAAMGHTRLVMTVAVVALFVNGVLNYSLIHGKFGLPEMGLLGSCTATVIAVWGMMLATAAGMRRTRDPRVKPAPVDWKVVRELLHLGWPISITLGVEVLLFLVGALMMGVISTTALAAHQVALNIASLTFMVPLGIAQAANVRVGFHMGAGRPHAARRAGFAAFGLGVSFMALMAVVMITAPYQIAALFNLDANKPADAEVIAVVVQLLTICAFFQIFDGAQTIGAGALRGLKDTRVPAMLAGFSYWGVGFPIAWSLGFPLGWGATGVWWGLALGLATAAVVLNTRFWRLSGRLIAVT
ncbi:MAG: MATE family efflux transporter [Rhodospirillaceae bacterium]|nr:MATE family efflux transporter [Rhodospirillaceae bacterium]